MCLSTVDPKPKTNRKTGYKVVDRSGGGLYPPCQGTGPYEVGGWITDPNKDVEIGFGPIRYPTGYHIFLSLAGAKAWTMSTGSYIVKVKFDDVVATGTQKIYGRGYRPYRVIVARKLFIPKKEFIGIRR